MRFNFDLTVFWLSFVAVLAAEVGCLCRTATIVAKYGSPWSVCLGTILANLLLLVPIFFGGEWLHKVAPPVLTRTIGGLVLIVMGLLILFSHDH